MNTESGMSVPPKKLNNAMSVLDSVVDGLVKEKVAQMCVEDIVKDVRKYATDLIHEEYGEVKKKVTLCVDDGREIKLEGVIHESFDTVLAYVLENEPIMMVGPAGSGKNVIAEQVSQTVDIPFYFTNAVTQEFKLTGFTDAMGVYHESEFYKAFKNGGLFFLDEMDASIPETLVILNSAIANGYFDFPAPIGKVYAHKDFRVIASGNTFGTGASYQYSGRNQLDGASLNRFGIEYVNYDSRIEDNMAGNDHDLLDFIRAFRDACNNAGLHLIISYREIKRVHKMESRIGKRKAIQTGLLKGMEKGDLDVIFKNIKCDSSNPFMKELKAIMEGME